MEFSVYHQDIDMPEFTFRDRGIWCEENCKGKYDISPYVVFFELEEDYQAYSKYWAVDSDW